MNTKEAIDILERLKNPHLKWLKKHNDDIDEIIELLQRGEKYEAMWYELNDVYFHSVGGLMKLVKQKYFPKPVKKTIAIEIEGDSKELIEANYSIIEDYLNNYKKNSSSASILKFNITKGGTND